MGRSSVGLLLAALLLAGCGAAEEERAATTTRAAATPTTAAPPDRCVSARAPGFRLCSHGAEEPPATPSVALGWASDGRARVRFPEGACGKSHEQPGVY